MKIKFTEEITKEIIKLYSEGIPLKYCAEAVGVHRDTVYKWKNKGENAKTGKYRQFYLDMLHAKSKCILHHQKKINESKDWKASKYMLQVLNPEHYVIENKVNKKVEHRSIESEFDEELFEKILAEEYGK